MLAVRLFGLPWFLGDCAEDRASTAGLSVFERRLPVAKRGDAGLLRVEAMLVCLRAKYSLLGV